MTDYFTTSELAAKLRCGPRKIRREARRLDLGVPLGGRAGFRYSQADLDALVKALRPVKREPARRRRRAA